MTNNHLDSDLVAAYSERRLNAADRLQVEAHLADCADCRRDVTAIASELGQTRRRRRLAMAVPLLAGAVIVITVTTNPFSGRGELEEIGFRPGGDPVAEGVMVLPAYQPAEAAAVGRDELRFVWGSDGPDAIYDLTVADSSGRSVWRIRVPDTTSMLPDSVRLMPGGRYHWWVDVLLPDGRIAKTGFREFELRP